MHRATTNGNHAEVINKRNKKHFNKHSIQQNTPK